LALVSSPFRPSLHSFGSTHLATSPQANNCAGEVLVKSLLYKQKQLALPAVSSTIDAKSC